MAESSNRPAAYADAGPDALVQEHRCPLGCNAALVSKPGCDVAFWSRGRLILYLRVKPHDGVSWLLPAMHRAIAHARGSTEDSSFVQSITGCARCHGDGHKDVTWLPLTHPIEDSDGIWTHWAPCPTNGQPILMQRRVGPRTSGVRDAG